MRLTLLIECEFNYPAFTIQQSLNYQININQKIEIHAISNSLLHKFA